MGSSGAGLRGEACLILCLLAGAAAAQVQRAAGEIRLEVKDPSGAPMEVSGRVQNLTSGVTRQFQTDARGIGVIPNLPEGRYRIDVSKRGFAAQSLMVEVRSQTPVLRALTMPIGAASSQIDVVSTTPVPGSDLSLNEIPARVQTVAQHDFETSGALDVANLLNRRLSGVNLNENQQNPFQPDLNYRGYTASPLLGTPQGISVYMDGVRQNQPFGDVVSWDLIPSIAISEVTLMPGSNPLFGLNTLGGALSIETKDGTVSPGAFLQVLGGSFGRVAVEGEAGGIGSNGFNWYLAGNLFHEDGWRVASPSDVRQLFSKLGWQGLNTAARFSFGLAQNSLTGNGLQEQRFLARDYASAYTLGDVTQNQSPFFNLSLRHTSGRSLAFSGNAYFRYIRAATVNPNLNVDSLDQPVYQPTVSDQHALADAGYTGYPSSGANAANTPFPYWPCIAQALQLAEPLKFCNGVIASTKATQSNFGLAGQLTWATSPGGRHNQLTAGAAWDRSSLRFQQGTQFAYLNPDFTLTPVNAFENGTTTIDGEPVDTRVNLKGLPQTWSLYASDTLAVGRAWNITVSGRYNRTTIDNRDGLQPGGGPGSLDGQYSFGRFNPAVGVTFNPRRSISLYASYSESSRAPTSIELGCADLNNPCSLPNALAGDPPLKQVVTRTFEAGARGGSQNGVFWSAGWFRAENYDDLLFVAAPQTGNGYFRNFGQTRRQGAEVHLSGRIRRITAGGNYTFLSATYQSPETVDGSSNSTNSSAAAGEPGLDGVIRIRAGDRIPLLPRNIFNACADLRATSRLFVDLSFVAASSAYARGNENNLHSPDGTYYLGPGTSPGYGVLNLGARYQLHERLQLFAQVNNLLNQHYYTAAELGPTGFSASGTFLAQPFPPVDGRYPIVHATFYSPGAPIGVWGGIRVRF